MDDDELNALAQGMESGDESFTRLTRKPGDIFYDPSQRGYWDSYTGQLWNDKGVDASVPVADWPTIKNNDGEVKPQRPSVSIARVETGQTVDGSTWWPGEPQIIKGLRPLPKGFQRDSGSQVFNHYIPPQAPPAEAGDVSIFEQHIARLIPNEDERRHWWDWCAFAAQNPGTKINHGILLAGEQGIGKDAAFEPLKVAVGDHNFANLEPDEIHSNFNDFVQTVILVVGEGKSADTAMKATNFYEKLKPVFAAPPHTLRVNEKNMKPIPIPNVVKGIIMTNDALGMYLPPGDRRLFVIDSKAEKMSPAAGKELYEWFANGGAASVARVLLDRDVSAFNAGGEAPMTEAKRSIIGSAQEVRRDLADDIIDGAMETLGEAPDVLFATDFTEYIKTHTMRIDEADDDCRAAVNNRRLHFKLRDRGYDRVEPRVKDRFIVNGKRARVAFVKRDVPEDERDQRIKAAVQRRPLFVAECSAAKPRYPKVAT